ncbi:hypothetical protein Tco_1264647 [Tanacetum coccineum]
MVVMMTSWYKRWCCSLILAKSNSIPHTPAQTSKTHYKHQDSRIKKAQVQKRRLPQTQIFTQNDFQTNESSYKNEPHFKKPESSFAFRANDENIDENNDSDDVVDENPQTMYHKRNKFMSFKPDIPDTPVCKSKPMISKQYSQESEVKEGNIFDNKEALVLAVRLKALNDGFQFIVDRGSPYEAFEMLPYYCYNLERKNKGTITRIKTDEKGVFEMLFIAIGASIRTFLNCLHPLIIIDAAHLKGLYKGTNLVAVGMDGNDRIVPIAFGICKGETALAVQNEFLLAFHVAYTREEFATSMSRLQLVQPDAYQKLCEAGPQRWSRAHCPLVCYNYMTSNSVESVNAYSVLHRKILVLKLAETYHEMVQEWYFKRRQLAASMTYEITDWVANKVAKKG